MAHTYKDSELLIDRLERKFKKKVRWSLNRKQFEPQKRSLFLDYLYEEDEHDEEDAEEDARYRHSRRGLFLKNY